MMKKKILVPIVLLVVALATLSFTTGKEVTLRLRPTKGKTYVINSKSTQTSIMNVQGQTVRSTQTIEGRQTFKATETSATTNEFETQINAMKFVISAMGMTFTYDSEHPEDNSPLIAEQAAAVEQFLNKPSTSTYNELGVNANPDNIQISQLSNVIIELPKENIHVGSQWNCVKTQTVSDYDIIANMTYTVTGISKKSVEVSFSGSVETTGISGNYSGKSTIDLQTGIVMESTISNSISLTVYEQGIEIPMTMTGTSTITVKERQSETFRI